MHTRPIQAAVRSALLAILRRIDNFRPDEVDVALELLDAAITDTDGTGYHVLVAEDDDGALMGYTCYGQTPMTDHTWDLYWIVVDPSGRGRGIGRLLYEALERDVQSRHGKTVRLETSSLETYGGTHRFYDAIGFSLAGRIADFYRDGDDLLTYTRRIA
jgi:ribosomal protein S18 acetylase RimI-like enzyme